MLSMIISTIINFYSGVLIIYILMSWIPNMGGIIEDIYKVLGTICDPYLNIFRRIIPPIGGQGMRLDVSPILAIIVLELVGNLLVRLF